MTDMIHFLPPGFRFHPTDVELIHYLKNKVSSSVGPQTSIIAEIDLYKLNPWELPEKAYFGDSEWFCFSPRDRKYPNSARPNRTAASGYWKATGADKPIFPDSQASQCVGVKKPLIFYEGRAPKGTKTNWMMHEYRLPKNIVQLSMRGSMRLDDWVLCRVWHKQNITEPKTETDDGVPAGDSFTQDYIQKPGQDYAEIDISDQLPKNIDEFPSSHAEVSDFQEWFAEQPNSYGNFKVHCKKNMNRSLKAALENIKRVLSLEALDEQAQEFSTNKRSCFLERSNYSRNSASFQISSA